MNRGLSPLLKNHFPDVKQALISKIYDQKIINPQWLYGFTDAEGCFLIIIQKSNAVQLRFQITQHIRDSKLLENFVEFFGCGKYRHDKGRSWGNYTVLKFSDIRDKIIPFYQKYPLNGAKHLDFKSFCDAVNLIESKAHLTEQGIDNLDLLKIV